MGVRYENRSFFIATETNSNGMSTGICKLVSVLVRLFWDTQYNHSKISVAYSSRHLFLMCEPVAWLSSVRLSFESAPHVPDSKEQQIPGLFFLCRWQEQKGGARFPGDSQSLFLDLCHHFCPHSFSQSRSLGQVQSPWTGRCVPSGGWGVGHEHLCHNNTNYQNIFGRTS